MKKSDFLTPNLAAQRYASLSRRQFLRGLGACLALPAFESLRPLSVRGQDLKAAAHLGASKSGAPVRMAFVYFPNGAIPDAWWPTGEGKEFELNKTMQPLANVKDRLQVISGLDCKGATPGPDGAGDHARASGSFLTGVRVKKTAGSDINANISIDQVAANQVGHLTRFPSLELSCDYVRKSGNCDSGYSCAYQYNLAWRSATQPLAPEPNPRLLFERLFGAGSHGERGESLKRRQQQQRSILDFVLDDARALQNQLAARDKQKLDDYLTSVREIEQRIQKSERFGAVPDPVADTPTGIPGSFEDYIQIMYEMMILAFQTDSTRIATFLLAYEGSNRTFKDELGFAEGHHYLTHHQRRQEMIDKVKEIDLWYVKQFARFLEKMDQTKDLDGNSLLHNSMIVYGSGNADGNRHTHVNLPIVLAGGGGGTITPGRFTKMGGVPITNLYLSMIDRMGVQGVEKHGDSTGRVEGI
ncbi:MAG: DUF1552 domain-containing protein [Verrucomicrobia bacterium]|nr:DUF1552 domain-containing protein [Verrucomicrobiota bacterium]